MMGLTDCTWNFLVSACIAALSYCVVVSVIGSDTRTTCKEPDVDNGEITYGRKDAYYYSDYVKIRCGDHYKLLGSDRLKCRTDGTWSENPPYCEEITCCRIPALMNGTISPNPKQSQIGSAANISCDRGFLLIGPEQLTCTINGVWMPDRMSKCKEILCPDIPELLNGEMLPANPSGPGKVTFECDEGYTMAGPREMTCTEDGKWSPNSMPYCMKDEEEGGGVDTGLIVTVVLIVIGILVILYFFCLKKWLKKHGCCKKARGGPKVRMGSRGSGDIASLRADDEFEFSSDDLLVKGQTGKVEVAEIADNRVLKEDT